MKEKVEAKDLVDMLEAMTSMMRLKDKLDSKLKNSGCDCTECTEIESKADYADDKKLAEKFNNEFKDMLKWAFGANVLDKNFIDKQESVNKWKELHPSLPPISLPKYVSNEISNLILVMQISPYWHEHKKLNK
jgi:hypothetical protein